MAAVAGGESLDAVSKRLGVSRSTLREWRDRPPTGKKPPGCPRCPNGQLPHAAWQAEIVASCPEMLLRVVQLRWLPGGELDALSVGRREAVARLDEFIGPKG